MGTTIPRGRVFCNNRSQAVRLPKEMNFPEGVSEVVLTRHGDTLIMKPVPQTWDEFFDNPDYQVSEDFMADYEQPPEQERDWWSCTTVLCAARTRPKNLRRVKRSWLSCPFCSSMRTLQSPLPGFARTWKSVVHRSAPTTLRSLAMDWPADSPS